MNLDNDLKRKKALYDLQKANKEEKKKEKSDKIEIQKEVIKKT